MNWSPVVTLAACWCFDADGERPVLQLAAQAVMVRFTRPEGARPLEVRTPNATVVVRGTVFFVEVQDGRTVVGVQRGRVEVVAQDGSTALVGSQQQASADGSGAARVTADSEHFVMLDALFPLKHRPLDPDLLPPPPRRVRRPRPRVEPPDPSVISGVVSRHMWLVQECYEHELKKDSSLQGSIEVEVIYGADGKVAEASVSREAGLSESRTEVTLHTLAVVQHGAHIVMRTHESLVGREAEELEGL